MGIGSSIRTPGEAMTAERDLTAQIAELQAYQNQQEVRVEDTSPKMPKVTLWNMLNGEPLDVPFYLAQRMMRDRLPDGSPMFTGRQDEAPEYRRGSTPCFLNPNSPEFGELAAIGIPVPVPCPAASLASEWSKRIHAERRHRQEWNTYQQALEARASAEDRAERRAQIDATLALAQRAAGIPGTSGVTVEDAVPFEPEAKCPHDGCGYTGTLAQVTGHKASHKRRGE